MASSEEPGVPICADTALLPAAMSMVMPARTISFDMRLTLSSSEDVHSMAPGPPRLMEAARMLYS